MNFTRIDFRIILISVLVGVLAWFVLLKIGYWFDTPFEVIEDESVRTGGAIAVLAVIWQYILEGEREDIRRGKER
jgi:hypothetical protein